MLHPDAVSVSVRCSGGLFLKSFLGCNAISMSCMWVSPFASAKIRRHVTRSSVARAAYEMAPVMYGSLSSARTRLLINGGKPVSIGSVANRAPLRYAIGSWRRLPANHGAFRTHQCLLGVIFVRSTRSRRSRHVRFAPIASELLHRGESTPC